MKRFNLAVCAAVAVFTAAPEARADFITIPQPDSAYINSTTLLDFPDPDYTVIHSLSDATLTITYTSPFNAGISEQTVPASWGSWCSPPQCETSTPRVGYTFGEASETLTFSQPLSTFGLEIQPDLLESEDISAIFFSGSTPVGTITLTPDGNAGGLLFAASTTTSYFTSVQINDLATEDFAFAQERYTLAPEPSPGWLALIGCSLMALGARRIRRRSALSAAVAVAVVAITAGSANAQETPVPLDCSSSDQNCLNAVTVGQVSFTYEGAAAWANSQYGIATLDYSALNALGYFDGYINVVQYDSSGLNPRWVIQNMPIFNSNVIPGLSMLFDLGAPPVMAAALQAQAGGGRAPMQYPAQRMIPMRTVNPIMRLPNPPPPPRGVPFMLTPVQWNAQGMQYARALQPALPVPAPAVNFNVNPLNLQQDIPWTILTRTPSVEQDVNQCAPASVSDSLGFLAEQYQIAVDATLNTANCSGIGAVNCPAPDAAKKSRVGLMDVRMGRAAGRATPAYNMISGKLQYISDMMLAANQTLTVKHQGVFCDANGRCTAPNANITVAGITSTNAGPVPTVDFIKSEIVDKKADLELAVLFQAGNALAGHAFNVIGFATTNFLPTIIYRQDALQGQPGGTGFRDGGFIMTYLVPVNNTRYLQAISLADGRTASVVNAIAEEPPAR